MNLYRVTLKIGLISIFFLITEVITEDDKVVKAIEGIKENIQDLKTIVETKYLSSTNFENRLIDVLEKLSKKQDNAELEQRLEKLENIIENLSPTISNNSLRNGSQNVYFSVGSTKRVQCYSCLIPFDRVLAMSALGLFVKDNTIFIAPSSGYYVFHFHGLTDNGQLCKIQFWVNEEAQGYLFDKHDNNDNQRWSMVSQSLMLPMQTGDRFSCLLHEGALRGGPGSHPFTTLIGYKVANDNNNKHNEL